MTQAASRPPLSAEDRVQSQASPCGICRGENCTGTSFCPGTCVFSCSIILKMLRIHSSPTLYDLSNGQRRQITIRTEICTSGMIFVQF